MYTFTPRAWLQLYCVHLGVDIAYSKLEQWWYYLWRHTIHFRDETGVRIVLNIVAFNIVLDVVKRLIFTILEFQNWHLQHINLKQSTEWSCCQKKCNHLSPHVSTGYSWCSCYVSFTEHKTTSMIKIGLVKCSQAARKHILRRSYTSRNHMVCKILFRQGKMKSKCSPT